MTSINIPKDDVAVREIKAKNLSSSPVQAPNETNANPPKSNRVSEASIQNAIAIAKPPDVLRT